MFSIFYILLVLTCVVSLSVTIYSCGLILTLKIFDMLQVTPVQVLKYSISTFAITAVVLLLTLILVSLKQPEQEEKS